MKTISKLNKVAISIALLATLGMGTSFAQTAPDAQTKFDSFTTNLNQKLNQTAAKASELATAAQNNLKDLKNIVAKYVSPDQTDFVASKLIGTNVYNLQDETIGAVKDLVLKNNALEGIVIGVGGFLGIGEHYVVVAPETLQMNANNGTLRLVTNATKDSLKAAPEFKYTSN